MKNTFTLTALFALTMISPAEGMAQIETYQALDVDCEPCRRMAEHRRDSIAAFEEAARLEIDPVVADQYSRQTIFPNLPKVYAGERSLLPPDVNLPQSVFMMRATVPLDSVNTPAIDEIVEEDFTEASLPVETPEEPQTARWEAYIEPWTYSTPQWLQVAMRRQNMEEYFRYAYLVENPREIDYGYWQLPKQPKLKDDKMTFSEFILSQFLPPVDASDAVLPETEQRKVHWLHTVGGGLQFSQAFISANWYQGGNDHLALLFNFNWSVALNTVYHPNLMFTSDLAYKLAVNSNTKEAMHRYSISQDLFQYNLKAGVKAFRKWFYSYNLQFKTQIFNSFPADSPNLGAAFLSPADLNMGLGMTYATEGLSGRLKLSASISPISYNLKVCASDRIDVTQFNILPGRHTRSEIGSNAEINLQWDITSNINWKSRLFLFSDYHYFQADWENTFTFNINRFLSTQFYFHPRFDSSTAFNPTWNYWQLKEILSFGLSYTFSTAP